MAGSAQGMDCPSIMKVKGILAPAYETQFELRRKYAKCFHSGKSKYRILQSLQSLSYLEKVI